MSMPKLLRLANFCRSLGVLRLVDLGIWILLILTQMGTGAGLGTIIWNSVSVIIKLGMAIELFPGKYIEALKMHGEYDINGLSGNISSNIWLSVIGIIWYGYQIIADHKYIPSLVILLDIAIIVVGIIAYTEAKLIKLLKEQNH